MRAARVFLDRPVSVGEAIRLPHTAHHHLTRVLHQGAGAGVVLFNGTGGEYLARLSQVSRKTSTVCVEQRVEADRESVLGTTLWLGLPRGERMDCTLQKAVELGVSAIHPAYTRRSLPVLERSRLARRMTHWRGVIIGACEQCGRNTLPRLAPPAPLGEMLETATGACAVVLDPGAGRGFSKLAPPLGAMTVLVGPEGGLTDAELDLAEGRGFVRARLGPRTLRCETAGAVALAAAQVLWVDLG
jgi:16S rRNA (uracil1498-N3)-methyltransferase